MAIANFTPLPTLPTPPNTQTDTKPIFLQKADAFNPALKGWADNFNSGTVPTLNDLIALLNQQLPYINTVADSDKAIRAIYADLSSIISVSEGIDSVQTVAEQISGVKDIADNLTEVLAAKGYAEDAKKWALIAESVANIGPATPEKIGLVKPDAVTTHITEDGTITVKNVAIGGNLEDLASARGQIGNYKTVFATGDDLNDVITSGTYAVSPGCANVPMNGPSDYYVLEVLRDESNANGVTQFIHSKVNTAGPTWSRRRISDGTWQPWQQRVQTNYIGDGIKISRSKALADGTGGLCIISVPEYEGATASAAGTSGLVPPAAAGQHESFLTGGGEYKPALTKISDSVNLADSTTAASATAVKAAYDQGTAGVTAANAKLPLTGGTMLGSIQCGDSEQFVVGTQEAPFYQMRARLFGVHSPAGVLCGIMTADAAANYFSIEPVGGAVVNSYCGRPGSAFQHGYFANMNGHPLAATIIGGSSGDGWFYRKYSDGFIEQWGMAQTAESGDTIITFPTPFLNGIYNIQLSSVSPVYQNNFYNVSMQAYSYSITSFYVEVMNGQTKRLSAPFAWYACGF